MKLTPLAMMETYVSAIEPVEVDISGITPGVHCTPHVFFKKDVDGFIPWVITRTCDHAGGTLRQCEGEPSKAICPLHNWEFDFDTLSYSKIPNQKFEHITKQSLPFTVENDRLRFAIAQQHLRVPASIGHDATKPLQAQMRHITHASAMLTVDGFNLLTDPWFVGECMASGWWLSHPPKADAWDLLASADLLYISHNHPDHLHPETLERARRDIPIIVPHFETHGVVQPLTDLGFTNIHALELKRLYRVNDTDLLIAILPTGDQRDDSALFVANGEFSALLTVDCVGTNQYILPKDISLLMTSFASGSSGWPLCYEVVGSLETRARIVTKNRGSALVEVMKYIAATHPQIYVPYAGYFSELAPRDRMIRDYNIKNSVQSVCEKVMARYPATRAVNPLEQDVVMWEGGAITTSSKDAAALFSYDAATIEHYLGKQRALLNHFDIHRVADYFCQSEFNDTLIVYLVLTDDDFAPIDQSLRIDFSTTPIRYEVVESSALLTEFEALSELRNYHHMLLKTRRDSVWEIVYHGRPLEELSIGFQCRFDRKPDQYNAAFWQHYTTHGAPMLRRGEDRLIYKLSDGAET